MADWIRLWHVGVRRPIEFNLECLRAAIPQPDDSVRLLASPNWKITLLGFKSIAELRAAGCSEDEDALPLYREGPGEPSISRRPVKGVEQ